ncbi:MAG: energy transducer TonB [Hymenobacter sp.]|nr:MAG: energy transducer TonB [Hymenobacter sp.]
MYLLPLLDAHLLPCPKQWGELLPQPGGRYCASCAHLVQDFSQAADLPAALAAARAAAPAGQVCGRFAATQVAQAQPRLRPRLRRFLVALVLVVGLGMSAQEALAQVRKVGSTLARRAVVQPDIVLGMVVEKQPEYKAGGISGIQQFIGHELHYPKGATKTGRVFIKFTVDKHGKPKDFGIAKGLEPVLDAEVLRVVRLLGDFIPGKQNGQPVEVSFTLPVTFSPQ